METISNEEEKYNRLRELSAALKIPVIEVFLTMEVRDHHGDIVRTYKERSHTWVRNMWNHVLGGHSGASVTITDFGAGFLSVKKTSGVLAAYGGSSWWFFADMIGPANNSNYGIVVGSSYFVWTFEQYALDAQVVHGTSSGQLVHAAQNTTTVSYNNSTRKWAAQLQRSFINSSGADITLYECGLVAYNSTVSAYIMMSRDVLLAPVIVFAGAQLTVTYMMVLTFPA